jgi:DNA polymerase-3 subunit delta'
MWTTIGQSKAVDYIKGSIQSGNLAHAYLITGPQHVGKTTFAFDIARALNCQSSEKPCNTCQSCHKISNGNHADVVTINLNSSSGNNESKQRTKISIENIREMEWYANLSPYEGEYRIFIIDGAENLSGEAANSFLKTLEEPPPTVIFLLLTSNESQLLPTVVSRCQRLELKPLAIEEVERILIDSRGVEPQKAKLLARISRGCLGWALTASVDENYIQSWEQRLSEQFLLIDKGWENRFSFVTRMITDRGTAEEIINVWLSWWHDLVLTKCNCKDIVTNSEHAPLLEKWAQVMSMESIVNFIESLRKSLTQISQNANLKLVFEVLMIDMPMVNFVDSK